MPKLTFGARSFALTATGLALFALFALHEACPGHLRRDRLGTPVSTATEQDRAEKRSPTTAAKPRGAPSLLDFPAGAEAPAGPHATRPRRPVRLATRVRASIATLLQATGGVGFHPESAANRGHGVRLQLTIAQSEEELISLFLRGGDDGGADLVAMSLERFVALLPRLQPARPKIFLLLANSRGADSLLTTARVASIGELRGRRIAYDQTDAGLYFLTWRMLKEGLTLDAVTLKAATSPAEALRWLREGQVDAALVHDLELARGIGIPVEPQDDHLHEAEPLDAPMTEEALAVEGAEEGVGDMEAPLEDDGLNGDEADEDAPSHLHRLASTADAPRLVPQVLIGRGEFLARYPDVARRTARALLAEALNTDDDPLPAARRLLEQVPTLRDPRDAIRREPPASFAENKAFFGLDGQSAPVAYADLFASIRRVLDKLQSEPTIGEADDFFWEAPLRRLSAKSIASGRMIARRAAQARATPTNAEPDRNDSEAATPPPERAPQDTSAETAQPVASMQEEPADRAQGTPGESDSIDSPAHIAAPEATAADIAPGEPDVAEASAANDDP